jgi:flagellar protein FliO/FliZ
VIVCIALAGLTTINVDPAGASGSSAGNATTTVAEHEAGPPIAGGEQPSVAAAVAKMVSALALVILVAYAALYGLKKMMNRRYGGGRNGGSLEVMQSTFVGPHKQVSLVRVGKRAVLVGITDHQITTLTELDPEETEEFVGQAGEAVQHESFAERLNLASEKLKNFGLRKKRAVLET